MAQGRDYLSAFAAHGVRINEEDDDQAHGDCPFCKKGDHFFFHPKKGLWDCKSCGKSGDFQDFLRLVIEWASTRFDVGKLARERLARDRKLPPAAFKGLGIGYDRRKKNYLLPVHDVRGKVIDLRRWKLGERGTRATPRGELGLFNVLKLLDEYRKRDPVYVCEGEWDAVAMRWMLKKAGAPGLVVGVPGANIFKRDWAAFFSGRTVYACYDNDSPGESGELKLAERLSNVAAHIHYIHWTDSFPPKFDVRDYVVQFEGAYKKGFRRLKLLFQNRPRRGVDPDSGYATNGIAEHAAEPGQDDERPAANGLGLKPDAVQAAFRKHLYLPNMDPLRVTFGTAFANRLDGDPLWVFMVGPPGCGKSEVLMALGKSPLTYSTTSLTPHSLISGGTSMGGADPSLIPHLNGKVLVIKDFTVILSMHYTARDEIFGVLRDAYDGKTEKVFGTGVRRSYISSFGILAGVTPKIDSFNTMHQSLGERFLKYRFEGARRKKAHDSESERIKRAISNINKETGMREELQDTAAQVLDYDFKELLGVPKLPDKYRDRIIALAKLIARMRGVVEREIHTQTVSYKPVWEVGTRLGKQFAKLSMGIAIYDRSKVVGPMQYALVAKVARDTCPDRVEEIVYQFWKLRARGEPNATTGRLGDVTRLPKTTCYRVVQDLQMLRVVDRVGGTQGGGAWKLNRTVVKLIEESRIYDSAAVQLKKRKR